MSNLSEMMEVNKGTMTTMLNKLVEDGYVKRSNSIKDRRTVFVELTDIGIEAVGELQSKMLTALTTVVEKLQEDQQQEVSSALSNLSKIFKEKR